MRKSLPLVRSTTCRLSCGLAKLPSWDVYYCDIVETGKHVDQRGAFWTPLRVLFQCRLTRCEQSSRGRYRSASSCGSPTPGVPKKLRTLRDRIERKPGAVLGSREGVFLQHRRSHKPASVGPDVPLRVVAFQRNTPNRRNAAPHHELAAPLKTRVELRCTLMGMCRLRSLARPAAKKDA